MGKLLIKLTACALDERWFRLKSHGSSRTMAAIIFASLCGPLAAAASWPTDPLVNVPLCIASGDQSNCAIASDGAGGAIITWHDSRSGNSDIYAQRIAADGTPQWTANGLAVCSATNEQSNPTIAADGAGGAIVTWEDKRGGFKYDIYTQRISAGGVAQWTADGVALCTAGGHQQKPTITPDGAGGAIVTWMGLFGGYYDIYAQRISEAGVPLWTVNGVALCTAAGYQYSPVLVSDGASGAIVTWRDQRTGGDYTFSDTYAQRISAGGVVQWTPNGVAVCTATGPQQEPAISSDGAGGAIVIWFDYRSGNYDIYAQRISAGGVAQWTADGVAFCTRAGEQAMPTIIADGAGGAIATWRDNRSDSGFDIYAQRMSAGGAPLWTVDGVALCTAADTQVDPTITADGMGGAIVTWYDYRSGDYDIYAQRISLGGAVQWAANGVAVCSASGFQIAPTLVADGAGGAIVTWYDRRNSPDADIYAQRIPLISAPSFTDIAAGLTGVNDGSVAWGDYDNDGDLDILLTGSSGSGLISSIYRNSGGANPTFTDIVAGLTGVYSGSVAWGDYDNDGDLDILLTGYTGSDYISKIYRNSGGANPTFTDIGAGLAGVAGSSVAWGDYDNDGDLDLLLTGGDGSWVYISKIYRNSGGANPTFTDIGAGLPGVQYGSVAWGDYDNDGDLDILLTGQDADIGYVSRIYENSGGANPTFTDIEAHLPGVHYSSVAWGDYDNDGDVDILLTGDSSTGNISRIYRNLGGADPTFTDIVAGLTGVVWSSVAWGDYDNDGDLDILQMGQGGGSQVYQNSGGANPTFTDIAAGLPGVSSGSVAWGDYDNDGDLDILLTGSWFTSKIFRNSGVPTNAPPQAPGNLAAVGDPVSGYTFSWTAPSDDHTPAAGLTYNLRVGTTSGGDQVSSAMAAANGYRRVVQLGNTNHRLSWHLALPRGSYYWAVQALDGAFAGSAFATGQSLSVSGVQTPEAPRLFALRGASPNPFNPATTISFALPQAQRVRLAVYDLGGRLVRVLVDEDKAAGSHEVQWNGTDDRGQLMASGVYVCRMEAGLYRESKQMTLLK